MNIRKPYPFRRALPSGADDIPGLGKGYESQQPRRQSWTLRDGTAYALGILPFADSAG